MLGRAFPESGMANHDRMALRMERPDSQRPPRPPLQPSPQLTQQPRYQPASYYQYPGAVPYVANNLAYPQPVPQPMPTGRDWFNPFDEEEQERKKRGLELVPIRPVMNGIPPPWAAYPGGYGPAAYGRFGGPLWPALPPPQPAPPPLPPVQDEEQNQRKAGKHVRHSDRQTNAAKKRETRSPPPEIRVNREVDGVLTPDSGDLTVHLTMDLEEDLEYQLDEMNHLSRLGLFSDAKEFFSKNLQHHLDNPYVLVQYAGLLLHQGDFKGATLLKDDAIYKREGEQADSEELRMLRINWELLQALAKSYTLDTLNGVYTIFQEVVDLLRGIADESSPDKPIGSTEVEILALTLRLTSHPVLNSRWLRYGAEALAAFPATLSRLYKSLLRQGRIWDLHDLIVLMPTVEDIKEFAKDVFDKELIPSLRAMVSDWLDSVHGYDTSTTLGLLSILTHILLEPVEASEKECIDIFRLCLPLGMSVVENDRDSLKSRPYLRLLLAKSRFAETASRQAADSLVRHLESSPGVFYQSDPALLPIYVPSEDESPRWTPMDQPAELKDPVRLVLRSAIELEDLKTEAIARRELIRLSNDPRDELDKLCTLQLSRQGDLNGYGLTLGTRYLVSNTKAARAELAGFLSRLLSDAAATIYWGPSHEWILNMLLYRLEEKSTAAIHKLLERSHADYWNIEETLLQEISRKLPALKDWVDQQRAGDPTPTKPDDTVLPAGTSPRRDSKRPSTRVLKASGSRQKTERTPKRAAQGATDEKKEARDTPVVTLLKPEEGRRDRRPPSRSRPPLMHAAGKKRQSAASQPGSNQGTPLNQYVNPSVTLQPHRVPPPGEEPPTADRSVISIREEEDRLAAEIRNRIDAEFNKRLEAARESERRRVNEKTEIFEGLKREVEAIRKEAIEQTEKKNRVEAQQRAERLQWERVMEESRSEKATAIAQLEIAAAEMDAKFKAERIAVEEAEKKMKEEFEMRKRRENEARLQAEREVERRKEAEQKAYEEKMAAERLREELRLKAEAEIRERREAENRAFEAAAKQLEEQEYRERIQEWAAERAQRDIEIQSQIHLKDAIGRKFAIPFSQGRTWQGMQEIIEAAFAHVDVIGAEIKAGHYDLIGPDGAVILPRAWEEIIQPGWMITMQMWPMQGPAVAPPPPPPVMRHPPIGMGRPVSVPPPPPPPAAQSDGEEEVIVVEEEGPANERVSTSAGRRTDDDDSSSGYGSTGSWKPSRRERIANAFSSLKSTIFRRRRRRRRRAPSTATSSSFSSEII